MTPPQPAPPVDPEQEPLLPMSQEFAGWVAKNDAAAKAKPVRAQPRQQPHGLLKKRCKQALLDWHKAKGWPACGIPIQNLPVEIKDKRTGQRRKYQTGRQGASDLIWLCRGVAFALELKMPWDQQRDSQERFQEKWEASGGVYLIVRSPEQLIADVERVMRDRRAG